MIFCPKCGRQNENDTSFCIYCGQALTAKASLSRTPSKVRQEYKPGYFDLDNYLDGLKLLASKNYESAVRIYFGYFLVVAILVIIFTEPLILFGLEFIRISLDTAVQYGELREWLPIVFFASFFPVLGNLFGWIPHTIFYKKTFQKEENEIQNNSKNSLIPIKDYVNFITTTVLVFVIRSIPFLIAIIISFSVFVNTGVYTIVALIILVLIVCVPISFFINVKLSIASVISVINSTGPIEACKISWRITKGNQINIVLVLIATNFLSGSLNSLFSRILGPFLLQTSIFLLLILVLYLSMSLSYILNGFTRYSMSRYCQLYHGEIKVSSIYNSKYLL